MFFTCEIHNKRFSSLEQVKLHDSLFHKEYDDPALTKPEPVPRIKTPPPPPDNNLDGFTCHICAQTYPTQDLVLTHLTSHLPPDQENAKDVSPIVKTEHDSDSSRGDSDNSEWSNSVATTSRHDSSDDPNYSYGSNYVPRKRKKPPPSNSVAMTTTKRSKKRKPPRKRPSKPRSYYRAVNSPHLPSYNPLYPEGRVTCYFCGYVPYSGQLDRFYVHMNKHILEVPYRCGTCGRSMASPEALDAHKKVHGDIDAPRRFGCKLCKSSFRKKSTLLGHLKTHSTLAELPCPHCDKKFKYERGLRRHVRVFHTDDKAPIKCGVAGCKETFKRRDHLKRHLKNVHGVEEEGNRFPCPFCQVVFNFRWKYESHAVERHPREVKKLFRCDQCNVKLASFRQVREHCLTKRHLDRVKMKGKRNL